MIKMTLQYWEEVEFGGGGGKEKKEGHPVPNEKMQIHPLWRRLGK